MRKDEGYWAAVLLTGLANLTVTRQNWPSLWGLYAWPTPREPHDHRAPSPAWRRWSSRMRRLSRAGVVTELQEALATHVARYNDCEARAPQQERDNWMLFEEAERVPLDAAGRIELADFSSFVVVRPPRARTHAEFQRALATLRERLAAIADGSEARVIEAAQAILRARPMLSLVIGRVQRAPGAPRRRPFGKGRPEEWYDGYSQVRIFDGPADDVERLGDYLDGLLLHAARGGYWARIARCARSDCAQFLLKRVAGRDRSFCSDACRNLTYHAEEVEQVRKTRRRQRARARKEFNTKKQRVADHLRAYHARGFGGDDAMRKVREDLALTERELRELMR